MPTSTPPTDPDSLAVLHALTTAGVPPEDAYNATQGISSMAAANLIARFESKLDALGALWAARLDAQTAEQNQRLDALKAEQNQRFDALKAEHGAKLTALDTKLRMLLWMVPVAVAVIGILFRLLS